MAVYTFIDEEMLEAFLAGYDVGEAVSFKGIAEGTENSNYLLATEKGRFILTLYERRVSRADLPFFLSLMDHLAARGLPCPVAVRRRDGANTCELAGRAAALITFLEGVSITRPNVEHCRAVGSALGELHALGADFAGSRTNSMGLFAWEKLAAQIGTRADKRYPELSALVADELATLRARWPDALPTGIIHADLFPDNVFFRGGKLSGLIDFYFACTDFLAYDIVVTLNSWCFESKGEFNVTKARALIAGYQSRRALSKDEIAALPLLARGGALRFLLTRTIDWLERPGDQSLAAKDPGEYLAKLRFHRGVAGPNAYGLHD